MKRFGSNTHFTASNVHGSHQTSESEFGVSAAEGESGTAMEYMSRTSLLQGNRSRTRQKTRLRESLYWKTEEEDLYLASIEIGKDLGINKTSEVRGPSAGQRISSLLSTSQGEDEEETFKLFGFKNPGMVNFEIQGLLTGNVIYLGIQMGFGYYQSPQMKIPLFNFAEQFAAILAAMPDEIVSEESKARAIAALFDFNYADVDKVRRASKAVRMTDPAAKAKEEEWSFEVNSPPVDSGIKRQDRPAEEVLPECQAHALAGGGGVRVGL